MISADGVEKTEVFLIQPSYLNYTFLDKLIMRQFS